MAFNEKPLRPLRLPLQNVSRIFSKWRITSNGTTSNATSSNGIFSNGITSIEITSNEVLLIAGKGKGYSCSICKPHLRRTYTYIHPLYSRVSHIALRFVSMYLCFLMSMETKVITSNAMRKTNG